MVETASLGKRVEDRGVIVICLNLQILNEMTKVKLLRFWYAKEHSRMENCFGNWMKLSRTWIRKVEL